VEIKGLIKQYRNKPEIILDTTNQLVIIGNAAASNVTEKK